MFKKYFLFCFMIIMIFCGNSCCFALQNDVTLFQIGNASALFAGAIEGDMNYQELKKHGNFGLGTFNDINGEMIALNGNFYQIGQHGKTILVDEAWKTPYAGLVYFISSHFLKINTINNYHDLTKFILPELINKNIPYAIQIKGHFDSIELRSRKPQQVYQTKNVPENTYSFRNVSGTLVGFWFPEYLLNITVPGFHLHFISDDKKQSGHVLNIKMQKAELALQAINKIELQFPLTENYRNAKIHIPNLVTYAQAQINIQ